MITVRGLTKSFTTSSEEVLAVDDVAFDVDEGLFFVLLGASGSGKTTTLRMLAALEHPTTGQIDMDGTTVYSSRDRVRTGPGERPIAMMFQTFALWPHMTVEKNITFPLRHGRSRLNKAAATRRLDDTLALLHIGDLRRRPVGALSGGQQQRVALARAIAQEPKVLLMDEPLSNLDAKLRAELRVSIKELTTRLGITTVYVTHDQTEAMVMGDAIGVMHRGQLLQMGTAEEVYRRPAHLYVAQFMGEMNFLAGRVAEVRGRTADVRTADGTIRASFSVPVRTGDAVRIGIRQESVRLHEGASAGMHPGRVERRLFVGETHVLSVALGSGAVVDVRIAGEARWTVGDAVGVELPPESVLGFADAPEPDVESAGPEQPAPPSAAVAV